MSSGFRQCTYGSCACACDSVASENKPLYINSPACFRCYATSRFHFKHSPGCLIALLWLISKPEALHSLAESTLQLNLGSDIRPERKTWKESISVLLYTKHTYGVYFKVCDNSLSCNKLLQ